MKVFLRCLLCTLTVFAAAARAEVTAHAPWVRGTVAGQSVTGAFMELTSSTDTTLVGVESPVAKSVELHTMEMSADGMMKMRPLERLLLPAGKTVTFAPGGYHVMCMGPTAAVKPGENVTMTFEFSDKSQVPVVFAVKNACPSATTRFITPGNTWRWWWRRQSSRRAMQPRSCG